MYRPYTDPIYIRDLHGRMKVTAIFVSVAFTWAKPPRNSFILDRVRSLIAINKPSIRQWLRNVVTQWKKARTCFSFFSLPHLLRHFTPLSFTSFPSPSLSSLPPSSLSSGIPPSLPLPSPSLPSLSLLLPPSRSLPPLHPLPPLTHDVYFAKETLPIHLQRKKK